MNNYIGFAIPNMYELYELNKEIITLLHKRPEMMYENIKFDAFYGAFQFCIWDGGRQFLDCQQTTLETVKSIRDFYNNYNIPIRFIYTNCQIKEQNLYDRFCNLVTKECENEINEIVINSPLLEEYIRTNYPKYKIISSTTKCIKNKDELQIEIDKSYNKICLDYNLNHNFNLLNSFSNEQKEKIELLVNAACGANCEFRKRHYELMSKSTLLYYKPYKAESCALFYENNQFKYPYEPLKNNITLDEIKTNYLPIGITHFKLEGRTRPPISHILTCADYLIKPEYKNFFIEQLVNFLYLNKNN